MKEEVCVFPGVSRMYYYILYFCYYYIQLDSSLEQVISRNNGKACKILTVW